MNIRISDARYYHSVEILRFIFAIVIISYHYWLYHLSLLDEVSLFSKAYLGDEFFFFVSGFFIAKSAIDKTNNDIGKETINNIKKRIGRIAFPYYASWLVAFVLLHVFPLKELSVIINDLSNSIIELLFLDMAGFPVLFQTSGVGWFFSGLLITCLIIFPLIIQLKDKYCLIVAPLMAILIYGFLSNISPVLKSPHIIIGGVYKGLLRAFAGINVGVFIYGLNFHLEKNNYKHNKRIMINILWITSGCVYFYYMLFGGLSDSDYFIIPVIAIFVITTFSKVIFIEKHANTAIVSFLGKLSVYMYFSQIILYSRKEDFFNININDWGLYFIFLVVNIGIALFILFINELIKKCFIERTD